MDCAGREGEDKTDYLIGSLETMCWIYELEKSNPKGEGKGSQQMLVLKYGREARAGL